MNPFDKTVIKSKTNPFDTASTATFSTPTVDTRNPVTKVLDKASGVITDVAKRAIAGQIFGGFTGQEVPDSFSSAYQEGKINRDKAISSMWQPIEKDANGKIISNTERDNAISEAVMNMSPIGMAGTLEKGIIDKIAKSTSYKEIVDHLFNAGVPESKIPTLAETLTKVDKPQVVNDLINGAKTMASDIKVPKNPVFQGSKIVSEVPEISKPVVTSPELPAPLTKSSTINTAANVEAAANEARITALKKQSKTPVEENLFQSPKNKAEPVAKMETGLEKAQRDWEEVSKQAQSEGKMTVNDSLLGIISKTPTDVKDRVNVIDYLRTPHYVLEKIGLGKEAKLLSSSFRNYLQELPTNINKITKWSKEVSPESNPRIFDWLDGKSIQLTSQEQKVAGEIKTWLNGWADRLGMKSNERISNYITHIFPAGKGGELNEEIAKLIKYKVPGSVYDPYLLKRLGNEGYLQDTWAALDAYVKTATRKVHMDPALEKVKAASQDLEVSQMDYVKSYIDSINMRPTSLDTSIDNGIKTVVGYKLGVRPTKAMTSTARQIVSRAKLGLSVTAAMKNLTQGVNTFAELGTKYTTKGYIDILTKGAKELEDMGVLNESFIEDRTYSAVKKFWEKFDKVTFWNFEATEKINRGAAYYGAKAKALAEGKTEEQAIDYGREIAGKTQFQFGSIDTPVALSSDIVKTLAQFQTFTIKQIEFLAEKMKNKEYASLARYVGASAVVYGAIGGAFGMSMWDMLPSLRFGVPPSLDLPNRLFKNVAGAQDQYGKTPTVGARIRDTGKALLTDVVPGGAQIDRTIGGFGAVDAGKSTTASGNFQYKIKQTPENYVRGALFGKSNLPEAKVYQEKKSGGKVKVSKSNPFD